jgi:hypothetical protein
MGYHDIPIFLCGVDGTRRIGLVLIPEKQEKQTLADLKYEYCWAIDNNDPHAFVDVFTEDGVLTARKYADSDPYLTKRHNELQFLAHKCIETHDRQFGQHRHTRQVARWAASRAGHSPAEF